MRFLVPHSGRSFLTFFVFGLFSAGFTQLVYGERTSELRPLHSAPAAPAAPSIVGIASESTDRSRDDRLSVWAKAAVNASTIRSAVADEIATGKVSQPNPGIRPVSHVVVHSQIDQANKTVSRSGESVAEDEPLTLARLQSLAEQNNPTLAQAESGTWQAWGRYVQAGLYPNPQIAYTAQEIGEEGQAGNQGIQVFQRIVRGGKLELSRNVAAEQRQLADDQLSTQQRRVEYSVRRAYYSVLSAAVRTSLVKDLVKVATEIKENIDRRIIDGVATELEQVQANLEFQKTLLMLEQAERNEEAAWRQLEAVVGMKLKSRTVDGSLEDNLPNLDWEKLVAQMQEAHPLINQSRTRARQAQAALSRAEVQPTPDVFVTLGTAYQSATDTQVANVQIGMPLPIFNRNQGNITTAEANSMAATREVERVSLELQRRLARQFRNYEQSRAQVRQFRKQVLPLTKQALDLSQRSFEDGQIAFLQWLIAQRSFAQTRLEYAQSLANLWQSVVTLESHLLDDGLAHPQAGLD